MGPVTVTVCVDVIVGGAGHVELLLLELELLEDDELEEPDVRQEQALEIRGGR